MFQRFIDQYATQLTNADVRNLLTLEYHPTMPVVVNIDPESGLQIFRPCKHEIVELYKVKRPFVSLCTERSQLEVDVEQAVKMLDSYLGPKLRVVYYHGRHWHDGTVYLDIEQMNVYHNNWVGVRHALSCWTRLEKEGNVIHSVQRVVTQTIDKFSVERKCELIVQDDGYHFESVSQAG